jgi:hypothetical protein
LLSLLVVFEPLVTNRVPVRDADPDPFKEKSAMHFEGPRHLEDDIRAACNCFSMDFEILSDPTVFSMTRACSSVLLRSAQIRVIGYLTRAGLGRCWNTELMARPARRKAASELLDLGLAELVVGEWLLQTNVSRSMTIASAKSKRFLLTVVSVVSNAAPNARATEFIAKSLHHNLLRHHHSIITPTAFLSDSPIFQSTLALAKV